MRKPCLNHRYREIKCQAEKTNRTDEKSVGRTAAGEEELRQNLEEMQATQEESTRREDELIKYAEEAASREEILSQKIDELENQIKSLTGKAKKKGNKS